MFSGALDTIAKSLADYPLSPGVSFSYGTAGFRTTGSLLPAVGCRMAYVCALRSALCGGRAVGLMITASHNPSLDNGVKIVDYDGSMLDRAWEPFVTSVANASSAEDLLRVIEDFTSKQPLVVDSHGVAMQRAAHGRVHVARDTRATGAEILAAFLSGMNAIGSAITVVDHGCLTTPQLHTMVYLDSVEGVAGVSSTDYYLRVVSSMKCLYPTTAQRQTVVVDCANGIGALALQDLIDSDSEYFSQRFNFVLLNADTKNSEALNHNCGADYAQKSKIAPRAFADYFAADPSATFFSFDGDADRVVAFYYSSQGEGMLLDGDRIAILLATLIDSLLRAAGGHKGELDVGIVQTAYANGASTTFVEDVLGLKPYCAATGVKYLHPIAHERDIGLYFEANGHGTVLIDEERVRRVLADAPGALGELLELRKLLSQGCGDAIADMLACLIALKRLGWTIDQWKSMYTDLPSLQTKVYVAEPQKIRCTPDERRCVAPAGLQDEIDAVVTSSGDVKARAFVRPSGTEPLVRTYVEAASEETVSAISRTVESLCRKYCGVQSN